MWSGIRRMGASGAYARVAIVLGIAEMLGGLALLVFRHDGTQGFALLAIGAATFGSAPALHRR